MDLLGSFLDTILKPRFEEDSVDRLNFRYTPWMLLVFAILLSARQFSTTPIQCWVPAQFKGGWAQYVNDYCFVENTYWLPFEKQIPEEHNDRDELMLNYYQWVPFVLALQALMFSLPHILWRMLNWLSGLQVRAIITMACDRTLDQTIEPEEKEKEAAELTALQVVALHIQHGVAIEKAVSRNSNPAGWILRLLLNIRGIYVTTLYMLMKLLNIANLIGQFALLSAFLGPKYGAWGAGILSDLANGRTWFQTGHFPRVTLCDFEVYLFLWWWFLVLLICTVFNFIQWLANIMIPIAQDMFVTKLLNAQGRPKEITSVQEATIREFVSKCLKWDGVTMLRLVTHNAGDMVGSRVAAHLWDLYVEQRKQHAMHHYDAGHLNDRPTSL